MSAYNADTFAVYNLVKHKWEKPRQTGQYKMEHGTLRIEPGCIVRVVGKPTAKETVECYRHLLMLKSHVPNPPLFKSIDFGFYCNYTAENVLTLEGTRNLLSKWRGRFFVGMYHKELIVAMNKNGAAHFVVMFYKESLEETFSKQDLGKVFERFCHSVFMDEKRIPAINFEQYYAHLDQTTEVALTTEERVAVRMLID